MPPLPADTFKHAVAAFQAGRLAESRAACARVLDAHPGHAAAHHLMGALAQSEGRWAEAETWMRQALDAAGDKPQILTGFAQVLAAQGKWEEATGVFRRIIALAPDQAQAFFGLGQSLKALGHLAEAATALAQAIGLAPAHTGALNLLGVLFCELHRYGEARDCFAEALRHRPGFAEAHNNMAVACLESGLTGESEAHSRAALDADAGYAAAYVNLGNALRAQKRWGEAVHAYGKAVSLAPNLAEARNNIGLACLHGLGDVGLAQAHFRETIARHPGHAAAWTHLGVTHDYQGAFTESLECHERALALQPGFIEAANNRANALKALGRIDEAVDAYRGVVAAQPAHAEARHNLALALLAAGHYTEGWTAFEARWDTEQLAEGRRAFPQPLWRGEPGTGGILLLHAEQGFGDTIQFCRYAALAAARSWRVTMEVQPPLVRLMRSVQGVDHVLARGDALPAFDAHCPMMSLPHVLGTTRSTIPADIPYLAADAQDIARWRDRIGEQGRKIGLVWAGNPRRFSVDLSAADQRRSMPPNTLRPLLDVPDTRFFSLQKDGAPLAGVTDFMPECRDFADTAALIMALDLVISVDTAVAHLASALGKPVWLMNRFDTCWRWFYGREDSPWYPRLRLFRQPHPQDWDEVVRQVRTALLQGL